MDHHFSSPLRADAVSGEAGGSFGQNRIIEPRSEHTHTAIVLHGRGSSAGEFSEEFLDSTLSDGRTICDKLPGWRWVFPSSKELWSTAFEEHMPAWFEAHSLTDPTARQDLQVGGLVESVGHISRVIEQEVERLDGNASRVALGGISQGGAVGLWALLCRRPAAMPLGAFFAASTWLPFAADLKDHFAGHETPPAMKTPLPESLKPREVVLDLIPPANCKASPDAAQQTMLFMGHGRDDAYVDVELGREASHVLSRGGWKVEWKEYEGAEEEGHWFKVPEEMDDIHAFLVTVMSRR